MAFLLCHLSSPHARLLWMELYYITALLMTFVLYNIITPISKHESIITKKRKSAAKHRKFNAHRFCHEIPAPDPVAGFSVKIKLGLNVFIFILFIILPL